YNAVRSHTMRKYFNSALLNGGCDSFFVEYCMGHTLDDTRAAYFRGSPEKLKEIYEKYIPYLTIQKELNISESPEYIKIKSENEVLAREAVRATVEREEIQRMKADYDQKIEDLQKKITHELQMQMREFDKLKHTAPESDKKEYAEKAKKVRDEL